MPTAGLRPRPSPSLLAANGKRRLDMLDIITFIMWAVLAMIGINFLALLITLIKR